MYKCPICYKIMELDDVNYIAHCKDCGVSYNLEQIKKLINDGVNDGPKWSRPPYYVRHAMLTFTIHGIEHAMLPEGIIELTDGVFRNREIKTIVMPDTVETIGKEAFMNCSKLEKVCFGNGIKKIKENAFLNCFALKEVHVKNLKTWLNVEFEHKYSSYLGTSPLAVTSCRLFVDNKELKHLVIPTGTVLNNIQFAGCSSIESVVIQSGVIIKGIGIFSYCYNLRSVHFEGAIKNVDELCLPRGCTVTSAASMPQNKETSKCEPSNKVYYSELGKETFKILNDRKAKGVCQHCGGKFTFFTKKCTFCGKKKDY